MYPLFFYLCVGLYHHRINNLSFSRGSLHDHTIILHFFSFRVAYQALAGSAPWLSTKNVCTSSKDNKTAIFWLIQKGAFAQTKVASDLSLAVLI